MTVIAYRDGIMAADSAVWGDQIIVEHVRKIWRLADGSLFGCSGRLCDAQACADWLLNGGDKPAPAEKGYFTALVAAPDGVVRRIEWDMRPFEITGPYHTCGAHMEFLHGAMAAGASAEEAVRLAIRYGDSAAGEVQVERLHNWGIRSAAATVDGVLPRSAMTIQMPPGAAVPRSGSRDS